MKIDLGNILLDISKNVRGGILVFFPSKALMNDYHNYWVKAGLLVKIRKETKKDTIKEAEE